MSDAGTCRHCGFPATPGEVCPVAPWDPAHGRPIGAAAAPIPLVVPSGPAVDLVAFLRRLVQGDEMTGLILALMRAHPECEGAVRAELLAGRQRG